jgi:magnesium transporter
MAEWIDLLDPDEAELRKALPAEIHERALEQLLRPARHDDEPRPRLEGQDHYVFGVFLVPVVITAEDAMYYQEIDLVMTRDALVTVRKQPEHGRPAWDPVPAQQACRHHDNVAMMVYHLADDVAERFLDLVDAVNEEIEELEDHVEDWPAERVRTRLSTLRHDLLNVRRTLAPMRDAVRDVVDNRIEFEGDEVFTHDVELSFGLAYDKLLRANDNLELARDLVAGVRDYHQSKISNEQNEVMRRLSGIATMFLPLAFLTGFFGQNFDYLVNDIEPPAWTFWVLGVGLELLAALGIYLFMRWRRWY